MALSPEIRLAVCLLLTPAAGIAATPERHEWVLEEKYEGAHRDKFDKLRYEVPILMRQSLIDLAVRVGLDFNEGWNHPMRVRFADGAPAGVENALAYVEHFSDGVNTAQRMTINLRAYDAEPFNFEKVFRHELLHAMLNDAAGVDAANIPRWVHEGLAVYAAEQGDQMVMFYLSGIEAGEEESFLNGLDNFGSGLDYIEAYLAFAYMRSRHGINSVQAFPRALIANQGDVAAAIQASCFEDLASFKANARSFGLTELRRIKRTLRGAQEKPF